MRRTALRTGLAAWGTLAAGLLARKLWSGPAQASADGLAPGPPSLLSTDRLEPVQPPQSLPSVSVTVAPDGGAGHAVPLTSLLGRHGAVLNVWATWCGPCRREMPSLAHLARALGGDGITVLPLSLDRGGAASVQSFYRQLGLTDLPILLDTDGGALEALHLGAVPVTLLLDDTGHVVARLDGSADWAAPASIARVRAVLRG